jgi:hypothetical protein
MTGKPRRPGATIKAVENPDGVIFKKIFSSFKTDQSMAFLSAFTGFQALL